MSAKLPRIALLLLLVCAIGLALVYRDRFDMEALDLWLASTGWAAPVLFMLLYAVATLLFLPGAALTLAGGALFGPLWGTLYNLTGATIGATLSFIVARYLGAGWLRNKLGGATERLVSGVESEGWRFVAFTRLVPLFPFNLLNYALGFTRIPFGQYVIASFIFMLPAALAYTWIGHTGRSAVAGSDQLVQNIIIALALLATLAFIPRLVSLMRQKPMKQTQRKQHWQAIYRNRSPQALSWHQREPTLSLQLIKQTGIEPTAAMIDVGGGASTLVDHLLKLGHTNLSVLDISAQALEYSRSRLAGDAAAVEWIEGDVTDFPVTHRYSMWHDRAVFHFLTDSDDRKQYVSMLKRALSDDGHVIIAAFRPGGPSQCSGLDIVQYDAQKLASELGDEFRLVEEINADHLTPAGKKQLFGYFLFVRT